MIIDDEKFKQKIVDELNYLIDKKGIKWKQLRGTINDYISEIRYSDQVNSTVRSIPLAYRIGNYNNHPTIVVYDYALKKKGESTDLDDLPCIIVSDRSTKNSNIYKLMLKIHDMVEKDNADKESRLLDKLTLCLNKAK